MTKIWGFVFLISLISCQSTEKASQKAGQEFQFHEYTIKQLRSGYENQDFSIKDVIQAYIDRIENMDKNGPALNSIIQINPDAITIAEKLDAEREEGMIRGPLHGVPVLLKDNIDTHDQMATTAGSRALIDAHPLQDSHVAAQLRKAGAVILGKANLSEWANFRGELSSSGWSGIAGQTKNPYVLDRNPCGSSSGSAVAVSANLTMLAIGTETNGSIVCPANNNGIVGIKPTVGLISRSGIIPISFTQDTPGPMARTVEDAAICLGALVGLDSADSKTWSGENNFYADYTQFLHPNGLKGKRLGIYTAPLGRHFKVDTLFYLAVEKMKTMGAEVVEIDKISDSEVGANSFQVMLYEYKDGLNQYFNSLGEAAPIKNIDELIKFNENDSVELRYYNQKFLEMAAEKNDLTSEEYLEALASLEKGARQDGIDRVMDQFELDAIIAPSGGPAWKTDLVNGDSFQVGSSSPAARAGYPNISVPMGFVDELPVGISFFGRAWSEPQLLEVAYAYEQVSRYRKAPRFLEED